MQFIDNQGRALIGEPNYRDALPGRASNFPQIPPSSDGEAMNVFRTSPQAAFCWSCGRAGFGIHLELHHIVGGVGRRSDKPCNFSTLCGGFTEDACHPRISSIGLGLMLARKWLFDPDGADWRALSIIKGSFLPDPVVGDIEAVLDRLEKWLPASHFRHISGRAAEVVGEAQA